MKTEDKYFIHASPPPLSIARIVLRALLPFLDMAWIIMIAWKRITSSRSPAKRYRLAVCAIFKDEADYLREWIEYHRIVGVDHFYLYNNFSSDRYQEVLSAYVRQGLVEVYDWPVQQGQSSAYAACFEKHRSETEWMTFIDIDEFIVPKRDPDIPTWLGRFRGFPSVLAYWKMFGTSGMAEPDPSRPMVESLVNCWSRDYDVGKVFFNTDWDVADFRQHHMMQGAMTVLGFRFIVPPLNGYRKFVKFGFHRTGRGDGLGTGIQINHYWSRTFGDYVRNKIPKGDVFFKNREYDISYFFAHENRNTCSDYVIWRFLIQLKIALGFIDQRLLTSGDPESRGG